ncbi:hypothetical protein OHB12_29120 [Nocardia sp. NBC_01730]|uniref:hypothetical protein n=1 Tax=Nocardia sp. NBC_01730 TaxID=2975998 RepID=UPI002E122CFE|nr:hypothetical protein OHB12_29120 [Nocardia sp. NBC_01730]
MSSSESEVGRKGKGLGQVLCRVLTLLASFCAAWPFMILYTDPDTDLVPFPWDYRTAPLVALLISAAVWFAFPRARWEAVAFTVGVWALSAMMVYLTRSF